MEWWFTSDQHFDHVNIMKYCNRPWTDVELEQRGAWGRHGRGVR
jgi:calcineurin-like phosphoesterase family protein